MNTFKRAALVLLLASVSIAVYAELELLDDENLSHVKGQAGITIDIELELSIGEFAYKDGGSILVQGVRIGGNTNLADRTYVHNAQ
ncbi:MAG: hypothetical protein ACI9T9_002220 [Oleiphilaceae bacterium]|jgi:hypothetical protein